MQRLNCSDYLSADVRQILYGFSSVSDLFNICGLYWSASRRVGEQGLINDERLMITDFVHTENAEGNGGPQADEGGEQQLSIIGQQLKENYFLIAVQEKELVVCGQECPVIYRNLSEYFFKLPLYCR